MTDLELFLTVLVILENVVILLIGAVGTPDRNRRDVFAEDLETSMRRRRHLRRDAPILRAHPNPHIR